MIIIRKFFKDIYNKGNFKDYFKRNKLFFVISICLVILSVYTGINHTIVDNSFINYVIQPINFDYGATLGSVNNYYIIFIQKIVYSLYAVLMGLSLSILSILIVVANEVGIGNVFEFKSLFHLINDVFVLVGAFLVTKIELRFIGELSSLNLNSIFNRIKVPLKDLILTLTWIIVIVLIITIVESVLII